MTTRKPWADTEDFLFDLAMRREIQKFQLVGSTHTLGHGRDIDFAVFIGIEKWTGWPSWLDETWEQESSDNYEGTRFLTFRKGVINLITTYDEGLYTRYLSAMEVCKALKLKRRYDRVIVCRIVRDGMTAEQAESITVPGEHE